MKNIQILLSTYNAKKYIEELLKSITDQMCDKFEISFIIRDDGSTDNTKNIIESFSKEFKNVRIVFGENLGPSLSFFELIKLADNDKDIYMFCDQDDVWCEKKIMNACNAINTENIPIMYYCAMSIVDEKLKKIDSYFREPASATSIKTTFAEGSLISGCTMAFNNNLMKKLKKSMPSIKCMHDAWAHLVCISTNR